ncbi:VPLPA-CTERM-specific exosortase XrtD [Parvularcula maris]|uniref:VPLPA-CTERM-specific exosortase XrtD n=1 Tax=Parvularcula maris TaxID=2965077 RepID=A0A9X2RHD9_9PROT|nr:VPLPA-CTERM-specific exosortase XrtD [Parvularcula maris]MCQ8184769.1 VPLPA-CTERM-specific exosortase XrtD [Parvularcula maris]
MSTTVQTPSRSDFDWQPYAVGGALLLALVFLFHMGIMNLFERWGMQQELSHSYFIPLITAYLLWDRREALRESLGKPHWAGLVMIGLSALLVVGYQTTQIFLIEQVGLIVSIFGAALLFGGVSFTRAAFFPLAFLLFMIPPPFWIITVTSWTFQLWSSELGVAMIRMFGIPVLLTGNVIDLGVTKLQVVEACSGLRYLFPFLSLGALAAYFYKGPLWQRALVLLSTIPITIFMNSFRIALTGVLTSGGDTSHTEGLLHFFEGYVVFIMCIAILLGLIVLLARFSGQKNVLATLGPPECSPIAPRQPWNRNLFMMMAGGAAALVAAVAVLIHTTEQPNYAPDRESFDGLALELRSEGWDVQEKPLDVRTEGVLGADDYIVLDLQSPEGEQINLYTAYLMAQRNGQSWHSPRQCLPGGGWQFEVQEIVSPGEGNAMGHAFNRIVMKKDQVRYLVYYWYNQRGRNIADEIWMKVVLMYDVATTQRSDGAMIRMMTPIHPDETVADADARLAEIYKEELQPKLPAYIPE